MIISVTTPGASRLLFMGILTAPNREILEKDSRNFESRNHQDPQGSGLRTETGTGSFKHNGTKGLDAAEHHPAQPVTREPEADMANELLTLPDKDSQAAAAFLEKHEFDGFLGKAFEEKPIWTGLYESVRDVFFPVKLPPLQLTSTPIPVPDRMAVKTNPWAVGTSFVVNGIILLIILFYVG